MFLNNFLDVLALVKMVKTFFAQLKGYFQKGTIGAPTGPFGKAVEAMARSANCAAVEEAGEMKFLQNICAASKTNLCTQTSL